MTQTITMDQVRGVKGRGYLHNKGTDCFNARVVTIGGRMTAEQMRLLAGIAASFGNGQVTFTTRLSVEIPGVQFQWIDAFEAAVRKIGLTVGGTGPKVRPIVACKGTTCPFGLIDTFALAEALHRRFYEGWREVALPGKFKIAVGGCPNNCVKPDLNDLGIAGKVLPGGKRGYQVTLGGHWGRTGGAGMPTVVLETADEVLSYVERVLTFYRDKGEKGERFYKTLARLGVDSIA